MAIELTGDQKDAIDAVFQDISSDVTRGNGCFDRVDDMNDLVQGMLNDVRNATLEEVAQHFDTEDNILIGYRGKLVAELVRQMKEGKDNG